MLSSLSRHGFRRIHRHRIVIPDSPISIRPIYDSVRSMSVISLSDLDAVNKFTQLNSKCCIYYTADWCGPCQAIKPVYKDLAATYNGNIALGMVDVDDNPTAAADVKVSSIPTFCLYNNNDLIQTFVGADQNKLRSSLSELAAK
jgi:thiol-disulfide isomerase/thioredoxin